MNQTVDEILDSYADDLGSMDGTTILRKIRVTLDGVPGASSFAARRTGSSRGMRVYGTQRRLTTAVIVSKPIRGAGGHRRVPVLRFIPDHGAMSLETRWRTGPVGAGDRRA
ncbi:MAG: hypothetical protein HC779_05590, partial [Phyllobacteriaceae bacterium]|nr:hypothetical protein [Phyllobacteriaceae bacterium]